MDSSSPESYCEIRIVNIIPESVQAQLAEAWDDSIKLYPSSIETNFSSKILRLNQEKIQVACQIIGCKLNIAKSVSDAIFHHYKELIKTTYSPAQITLTEKYSMYTTNEKFIELLTKTLSDHRVNKKRSIFDFEIGLSILERTRPMIVLLGGTSGSGKSTVASLLASRFGLSTVLSTDSIRHIMRNFMTTDECPVLFASTYEAGNKIKVEENTPEKKRVILGFKQQAVTVQEKLDNIIQGFMNRGESIIIEGVHLTPDFMATMVKKYGNCIPFLVYIRSENKHRERFAVRSKYMTLEKKHNKYIQHFTNIRDIQKHLAKKADEHLVPKLNNSNIDKSVGIIHRTVIRCLRRVAAGESLFDPEKKNALKIYLQFNEVTKNIWSSETAKQYINGKISKANRVENVERFLFKDNDDMVSLNTKVEVQGVRYQHVEDDQGDNEERDGEKDDEIEATQIDVEQDELGKIDKQFKYKEDMLLLNEDSYNNARSQLSAISRKKVSERGNGSDGEEGNGKIKNIHSNGDQQRPFDNKEFRLAPSKGPKIDREEEKVIDSGVEETLDNRRQSSDTSPSLVKAKQLFSDSVLSSVETPTSRQNKMRLKFRELEELLSEKRSISVKGPLTQYYLKRIKNFVEYYNKRHADSFVKLYPQTEKYLLYKHNRSDTSQIQTGNAEVSEIAGKTILVKSSKSRFFESEKKVKFVESGTSEGEVEASEDENSHLSGSNVSGSMDANFHLTGKGYNLSDNPDFSDDFESFAKLDEEENSEGRTSLEIVESANSISEQSEEDVEDEDVILDRPPKLVK